MSEKPIDETTEVTAEIWAYMRERAEKTVSGIDWSSGAGYAGFRCDCGTTWLTRPPVLGPQVCPGCYRVIVFRPLEASKDPR